MNDIENKIKQVIDEINTNTNVQVSLETNFFESNILDSYGMLEFISKLENKFNIQFFNEDLIIQKFDNIKNTAQTLKKYQTK